MKKLTLNLNRKYLSSFVVAAWSIILFSRLAHTFFIQTIMGVVLCYLFLTYSIWKKTDKLIALCFAYFSIMQIPKIYDPAAFYGKDFDAATTVAFQSVHAQGLIYLTGVTLLFVFTNHLRIIKDIFIKFLILDTIVMLIRFVLGGKPYFLFNNPAIDASFLAVMLPLVWNKKYLKFLIIPACLATNSSTSIAGLGLGIGLYYLSKYKFNKYAVCTAFLSVMSAISIGYAMMGRILLDSSGRYHVWELGMTYFHKHLNKVIGAGTGSFAIYGPTIQMVEALKLGRDSIEGFFWMHNDWLQILFENGAIGLILTAVIFVRGAWRLRNNPELFASLIVFGATASIQMHMRHILLTMLGAWLISMSMQATKKIPQL